MSKRDSGSDPYTHGLANSSVAGGHYMYDNGDMTLGKPEITQNIIMTGKTFKIEDPETGEQFDVMASIKAMQERLLILEPAFEMMEKYSALKDAYEHYKMLEKLLMDQNKQ